MCVVAGCVLHCVHGQTEAPGGGGLQLYIRPGQREKQRYSTHWEIGE
jgi:hypothetical protein